MLVARYNVVLVKARLDDAIWNNHSVGFFGKNLGTMSIYK
jgi:hypothetical protein